MDLQTMKGLDLVAAFNAIPGVKPVKKFADRETAIKRIEAAKKKAPVPEIMPEPAKPEMPAAPPKNDVAALLDSTNSGIPDMFRISPEDRKKAWDKMPPPKPADSMKRAPSASGTPQTKKATVATTASALAAKFKARSGTFREKLLVKLENHLGFQVAWKELCTAVYGNDEKANFGPLKMCLKGALTSIEKDKLSYVIKVDAKENSVGIYDK